MRWVILGMIIMLPSLATAAERPFDPGRLECDWAPSEFEHRGSASGVLVVLPLAGVQEEVVYVEMSRGGIRKSAVDTWIREVGECQDSKAVKRYAAYKVKFVPDGAESYVRIFIAADVPAPVQFVTCVGGRCFRGDFNQRSGELHMRPMPSPSR